jgi:transcriptional regulator with XRE-family HTH domain
MLYFPNMDERWRWVNRETGQRVAQARKRARLTQTELAKLIDKSRASVANIEAGNQPTQIQMIFELADHLHVTPLELLPDAASGENRSLSDVKVYDDMKRQIPIQS